MGVILCATGVSRGSFPLYRQRAPGVVYLYKEPSNLTSAGSASRIHRLSKRRGAPFSIPRRPGTSFTF